MTTTSDPAYRPVPDCPGYFANRDGEVWSVRRRGPNRQSTQRPRPLQTTGPRRLVTVITTAGIKRTMPARRVAALAWGE